MGLIRKQIGSESPERQVGEWFVKYAKHRVMHGAFYYPSRVLFKVYANHGDVLRQLMELYMCEELNEFVVFDFCNTLHIKVYNHSNGPHYVAKVMSMMDKHLLDLNEIIVYELGIGIKTFIIKRYGNGDWRVEPDQE